MGVATRERVMAAECFAFSAAIAFSLGKLGMSHNYIEEGTAFSNLSEAGCVSQQGTMERVSVYFS